MPVSMREIPVANIPRNLGIMVRRSLRREGLAGNCLHQRICRPVRLKMLIVLGVGENWMRTVNSESDGESIPARRAHPNGVVGTMFILMVEKTICPWILRIRRKSHESFDAGAVQCFGFA